MPENPEERGAGGERDLADVVQVLIRLVQQYERVSSSRIEQHERYCEERQAAFRDFMKAQTDALEGIVARIDTVDQRRREGIQGVHGRLTHVEEKVGRLKSGMSGQVISWQAAVIGTLVAAIAYLLVYGPPWSRISQ